MIKMTILLRRKPEMSHEEFVTYHRHQHAPLFSSLPEVKQHVRRYVQCHTVPASIPRLPPVAFDGITELWFDDVAGLEAVLDDGKDSCREFAQELPRSGVRASAKLATRRARAQAAC